MEIDINALEVKNNEEKNRFEIALDGKVAVCEYKLVKDRIIFTHTEVPPELEGHGIATRLAKTGLEYAKAEQLKVMPLCPYVAGFIKRNPQYLPLVMKGFNVK